MRELIQYLCQLLWSSRCLLWPRRRLELTARQLLLREFLVGYEQVVFYKSGRSALRAVFRSLAGVTPNRIVLVPDYICNVVPRAGLLEGFQPVPYRTDDLCALEFDDLESHLRSPGVAAVVLASLFGAQNTSNGIVQRVRAISADVVIVLDECQNLGPDMPASQDARALVVFSFNRKTIPGAMGGGIAMHDNFLGLKPPAAERRDLKLEALIWLVVMNQGRERLAHAVNRWRGVPPYPLPHLEYTSGAERMHYDFEIQRIARMSLCRATDEMRRAACTQARRARNLARVQAFLADTGAGELRAGDSAKPPPFVPLRLRDSRLLGHLPLKGPYAEDGSPDLTRRPDLLCLRNEGTETLWLGR
jgi:hypothetical protein